MSDSGVVLDASAVIAYVKGEPGADLVESHLAQSIISVVNFQEIARFLFVDGLSSASVRQLMDELRLDVRDHDPEEAFQAAQLVLPTKHLGLGLADRTCLALAIRTGLPALTTDRIWSDLDIPGLRVVLAR